MSLFDSPWHILILLVVVLVLFGAKRLPGAAQSLGQSMHIFKKSVHGLQDDGKPGDGGIFNSQATFTPQAQPSQPWADAPPQQLPPQPPADPANQAQLDDLQRQIQDLQRLSAAGNGAAATDQPRNTQTS
jgi:sec-independent protein translocase protein TatA